MIRKMTLLALVVMLVAVPVGLAQAQELTETFTSDDGSLSFNHPAGWTTQAFGTTAIAADRQETIQADIFTEGMIAVIVQGYTGDDMPPGVDTSDGITSAELAESFLASGEGAPTVMDGPNPLELPNSSDATIFLGSLDEGDWYYIIAVFSEDTFALVGLGSATGGVKQYRDLAVSIAGTVGFNPPAPGEGTVSADAGNAPVAGEGNVVWQQQRGGDDPDAFSVLGSVVVGADDTIYVADGYSGIRVLDAGGNVTGTIVNNELFGAGDIAIAQDGTLWAVAPFDHMVYNLDTNGNLITSFGGTEGAGPGEFGEFSPDLIEVGPDGNIYVFDVQKPDGETAEGRIQVFTPNGEFVREFPTDPNPADPTRPEYDQYITMTIGKDGLLYLADGFDGIRQMDLDGNILTDNLGEDVLSGVYTMSAIAVGEDGTIYVAGSEGKIRTVRVTAEGTLVSSFGAEQARVEDGDQPPLNPGEFYAFQGLALLSNGDLVVADSNFTYSQIVRLSLSAQ